MSNKQPFHHRATILFTAEREMSRSELDTLLFMVLEAHKKAHAIIPTTLVIEELDVEAGDPADLL